MSSSPSSAPSIDRSRRGSLRLRIVFFARDRVTLPIRHDSLVVQDEPGRGSRSRRQAPGMYVPTYVVGRLKFNFFFCSVLNRPFIV